MSILFHSRNQGKGFSWTFQNIKQIDDLLDQGEVELDPKKRADIYGRFQVLAMENALFLPAFVRETIHVYRARCRTSSSTGGATTRTSPRCG